MCKISIVMPVYNGEKYLGDAINSILNQTFSDFELIIVDDGSRSTVGEICKDFQKSDGRIKYIRQENSGVSAARNNGLALAKGEYVFFCDCDDTVDENLLFDTYNTAMETDSDIVEFGRKHFTCDKDGRVKKVEYIVPKISGCFTIWDYFKNIDITWDENSFSMCGHLFRRETVKNIKIENIPLCEDTVFVVDAVKASKKIAFLNKPYYNYYLRIGSSVSRYQPRCLESKVMLIKRISSFSEVAGCDRQKLDGVVNKQRFLSYFSNIYNLILPSCNLSLKEKKNALENVKRELEIDKYRKLCRINSSRSDRIKSFLVRNKLEWLIILFGRAYF